MNSIRRNQEEFLFRVYWGHYVKYPPISMDISDGYAWRNIYLPLSKYDENTIKLYIKNMHGLMEGVWEGPYMIHRQWKFRFNDAKDIISFRLMID